MKRYLLLIAVCLCALCGTAQVAQGLNIASALNGLYSDAPYATETIVSGKQLQPYNLKSYHSLTVTDPAAIENLQRMVKADRDAALEKEEKTVGGRLNYAFYEFRPGKNTLNRFVFFFSNKSKAILIYMEGHTDVQTIKKLIKK